MRRSVLVSIACGVVIIFGLFAGDAHAQGLNLNTLQNWNFIGMGARARAMGGAFLGVSNDGSAGTWNPAGLILNDGVFLTANYSYSNIDVGLDHTPINPTGLPTEQQSADATLSALASAAFVAPLTLREHEFYLSAYYHRVQDVFARGEFLVDEQNLQVRPQILGTPFDVSSSLSGNIGYIGAAFGTSITSNLFVGGNLNIVTGDGSESHVMVLDSTRFNELDPFDQGIDSVVWRDRSEIDYSGLNFTLAAMYRADRWSAGLTFTPGWTLTQNLDYLGTRTDIVNRVRSQPLGIVPGPDGTDREIQMPYSVGLGGAYYISDNVMVAADYQFSAFKREGEYRFQDDPVHPDAPMQTEVNSWYNLHQIRLGMEYMREYDWGVVPIRVGVRNDPRLIGDQSGVIATFDQRAGQVDRRNEKTPRDDYFLPITTSGTSGDQIQAITFSFGSGVHWSQIHLDFALEFMGFSYDETGELRMIRRCDNCDPIDVVRDEWGLRTTNEFGSYSRTYEDNRIRFSLNFTGYF
ncbi:MAG: hypothetical protein Kow0074_04930 [Candidatus Zixiibacteriota bacterium]